jgi:hypothetical protein
MKKIIFAALAAAAALASCKSQPEQVIVEVPALRASYIYDDDSVYVYRNKYGDQHKDIALSYIEKGKDAEKTDPRKALYYIRRAITLRPEKENYAELARMLMQEESYNEAMQVYTLLASKSYVQLGDKEFNDYMFGAPDEDTYYNYILSHMLTYDWLDSYLIWEARDAGMDMITLKNRLESDERFTSKFDTVSINYRQFVFSFMSEEERKEYMSSHANFANFIASFKDSLPVFNIDEKQVREFLYDDYNGRNDNEENYSMSELFMPFLAECKDGSCWYAYNCNHLVRLNDKVLAAVYAIDTSATACPSDMRHIYHRLVTYDHSGKIIDSKVIAWQAGEELGTVHFNRNSFIVNEHRREWRKPYDMNDFDNDIVKVEEKGVRSYKIDDEGRIIAEVLEARE